MLQPILNIKKKRIDIIKSDIYTTTKKLQQTIEKQTELEEEYKQFMNSKNEKKMQIYNEVINKDIKKFSIDILMLKLEELQKHQEKLESNIKNIKEEVKKIESNLEKLQTLRKCKEIELDKFSLLIKEINKQQHKIMIRKLDKVEEEIMETTYNINNI